MMARPMPPPQQTPSPEIEVAMDEVTRRRGNNGGIEEVVQEGNGVDEAIRSFDGADQEQKEDLNDDEVVSRTSDTFDF